MNTSVSFKLAKLLKEKGYKEPCTDRYWVGYENEEHFQDNCICEIWNEYDDFSTTYYSAPIIADVLMWIYEKYGVWIYSYSVAPYLLEEEDYPKMVFVAKAQKFREFDIFIDTKNKLAVNHFWDLTEAYEAAIEYTLNKLI